MAKGNIYTSGTAGILELFGDYVEGSPDRAALAISTRKLSSAATLALDKSLDAFGYGRDACSYAVLAPSADDADSADGAAEEPALDPQALFLLIEGVDPLILICADERAAALVAQAYRTSLQYDAPARIFGRPAVAFRDLDGLMNSDAGKQKAWKLLKSLPRR